MAFLTALASNILKAVLLWVATKVGLFLKKLYNRREIQIEENKSVEPLQKATTAQEIDDATHDALDGI